MFDALSSAGLFLVYVVGGIGCIALGFMLFSMAAAIVDMVWARITASSGP